ncbi:hypothetical protein [Pseudotabrizicola sp. 4114]|uniref:hypothetical protein n=1 Tax=Pseudotabrizicola sp. 4114 TaxID=2817731 RepID=UPI00285B0B83|nr:hypothetical protein [Pseudorhodobacter sp. 4114]
MASPPSIAASAIAAGAQLLGGLISGDGSRKSDLRAQTYNNIMYDKSVRDGRENYERDVLVNRENYATQVATQTARDDHVLSDQRWYDSPTEVRKRAEDAGFNPLAYAGNFSSSGVSSAFPSIGGSSGAGTSAPMMAASGGGAYMGAAVADAGMILADGMARREDLARASALEQQNKELASKVTSLTLRPEVGGVYERRASIPSISQALGVRDAQDVRSARHNGPYSGPSHSGSIDSVEPNVRAVTESYTSHGSSTPVPLGPDFDEIMSGALFDANNKAKARARFENSKEARAGRSQRFPPSRPQKGKGGASGSSANNGPFPGYPLLRP